VSRWTYERVAERLTDPQLVELVVLVSVCNLIARVIKTFEVELNP
jgi:alkylhydroperoxidase family enzyme